MKKTQLRKLIKESIKQVLREQAAAWPSECYYSNGGPFHMNLDPSLGRCITFANCDGSHFPMFSPGGIVNKAVINGQTPQIGDIFQLNQADMNQISGGSCFPTGNPPVYTCIASWNNSFLNAGGQWNHPYKVIDVRDPLYCAGGAGVGVTLPGPDGNTGTPDDITCHADVGDFPGHYLMGSVCGGGTVSGCMDPSASNYNANATTDDGSCIYDPFCHDFASYVQINFPDLGPLHSHHFCEKCNEFCPHPPCPVANTFDPKCVCCKDETNGDPWDNDPHGKIAAPDVDLEIDPKIDPEIDRMQKIANIKK